LLKFQVETRPRRGRRKKLADPFLAGEWITRGKKSRVDTRERDEFTQQLFGRGHGFTTNNWQRD
jgi:hypothetical protein